MFTGFKLAEKMVRLSDELIKIVRIVPSQKSLVGLPCNVEYKAISAEAGTAHGLSPTLLCSTKSGYDPFVEAIETAQGAHLHPLLIAINLFSLWLDDAANSADPRIVSHLYTAPKDSEITDRKAWAAANPAMAQFRSQTDIEDSAAQAERLPAKANSFRWLYLNQRIEAQSPFLSRAEFSAHLVPGDHCLLDRTCRRAAILQSRQIPYFFLPSDGLRDKSQAEKTPYDLWADQ